MVVVSSLYLKLEHKAKRGKRFAILVLTRTGGNNLKLKNLLRSSWDLCAENISFVKQRRSATQLIIFSKRQDLIMIIFEPSSSFERKFKVEKIDWLIYNIDVGTYFFAFLHP